MSIGPFPISESSINPSLYIHIPFCRKRCAYCDFYSCALPVSPYGDEELYRAYTDRLIVQLAGFGEKYDWDDWATVYIGGGTPSLMPPGELARLFDRLGLRPSPDREITIEVNPEFLTEQRLQDYHKLGINRISMGIQSLNGEILERMGRLADREQCLRAARMLREWPGTWSADYIFAYPGQSAESQRVDIGELLALEPPHFSLYHLTVEEGTKLSRSLGLGEYSLPGDEEMERAWDLCMGDIGARGYERYEISSFCRNGRYARHNRVYWQSGRWLGLGAGAASMMEGSLRLTGGSLGDFLSAEPGELLPSGCFYSREEITAEERTGEILMMGLRTKWGVDGDTLLSLLGSNPAAVLGRTLDKWRGKLLCDEKGLRLNSAGLDWHSAVMVDILLDLDKFF